MLCSFISEQHQHHQFGKFIEEFYKTLFPSVNHQACATLIAFQAHISLFRFSSSRNLGLHLEGSPRIE